jgi:hypothetical protein
MFPQWSQRAGLRRNYIEKREEKIRLFPTTMKKKHQIETIQKKRFERSNVRDLGKK